MLIDFNHICQIEITPVFLNYHQLPQPMFTFRYAELVLNNEPLSITFTEEDDSSSRDGKTRILHSPQKRRRGTADTPAGAGDRPTTDGRTTSEGRGAISEGRGTTSGGGRLTGYEFDVMPSEEAAMKKVSSNGEMNFNFFKNIFQISQIHCFIFNIRDLY